MWSTWIERWQQKKFCAAGERCESTLERESVSLPLPQNALYALVVWIEIYREQRRNDVGWDRQNAFHEEVIQTFSCRNESWSAHQKTRRWKLHSKYRRGCKKFARFKQRIERREMVGKTSEIMQSSVVSTSYPALAGASRASGYPVAKFTGGSPNPLWKENVNDWKEKAW